jgi:hypothetical protein
MQSAHFLCEAQVILTQLLGLSLRHQQ